MAHSSRAEYLVLMQAKVRYTTSNFTLLKLMKYTLLTLGHSSNLDPHLSSILPREAARILIIIAKLVFEAIWHVMTGRGTSVCSQGEEFTKW
jgi:hypothetical protein